MLQRPTKTNLRRSPGDDITPQEDEDQPVSREIDYLFPSPNFWRHPATLGSTICWYDFLVAPT
jgi:hypothetical protein